MKGYDWYKTMLKPKWAPPAWLFGPVWTILYVLITVSYGYAAFIYVAKQIPFLVLLPFVLNLIFNFIFTPIQFGLRSNRLAAVDITLTLATLVWVLVAIYPYAKWVSFINAPYLLWVCFATVLQFTVTF